MQAGGCAGMLIRREVIEGRRWSRVVRVHRPVRGHHLLREGEGRRVQALRRPVGTSWAYHDGGGVAAVEDGQWVTGLNIGRDLKVNVETFEGFLAKEKQNPNRGRGGCGGS